jgi:hypothetical protein
LFFEEFIMIINNTYNNTCDCDCNSRLPAGMRVTESGDRLSLRESVGIARQILREDSPMFKPLFDFMRDNIPYMAKVEVIGSNAEIAKIYSSVPATVEIWHVEVSTCQRHGGVYHVIVQSAAPKGAVKIAELAV